MTRICAASGCTLNASGYSPLCPRHRSIQGRHGHPEQSAVTVHELRHYRRKVAERRKANPQNHAWRILEDRWARILDQARGTLAAWEGGRPCNRHAVQAAYQLQALAGAVPAATIVEASLAMVMMWSAEQRRFRSDRAFDHQLVRRVRGLASVAAGSHYNHKTGRVHKVYKDLPPRTVHVLAGYLKGCFGVAGVQLADLEHQRFDREAAEGQQLAGAIEAMQ